MKTTNELPNPKDFMKLGEDAFIKNVHEKLRETLSPNEKQMWISGYLLALTNFKQFQDQDNKLYSEEEVLAFGKSCFYKGFEKAENDDANCYTAFREEIGNLVEQFKNK